MHLFHNWVLQSQTTAVDKSDPRHDVNVLVSNYACRCGKQFSSEEKISETVNYPYIIDGGGGTKAAVFESWDDGDCVIRAAVARADANHAAALRWVAKNKVKPINIQEDRYTGGRWSEEERGSTVTVYYKARR